MNDMNDMLVVDDNPVLVSVLSEIFRELGYSVRAASDGFEALAAIRNRVPDILISDLNMPHMSGVELLSIVRRRFPTIAVIAMSGAYSGNSVPSGVAADGYYAKGSSRVARLFEILAAIADESTRRRPGRSHQSGYPGCQPSGLRCGIEPKSRGDLHQVRERVCIHLLHYLTPMCLNRDLADTELPTALFI
jgi:CheY-like chemotaxis protein